MADPAVDALIDEATAATGPERAEAFAEAFRLIGEEDVALAPLFNMVGTVRVADGVSYAPDVQTSNEIKLSTIRHE